MPKRIYVLLFVIILLVSACERPASKAPISTPQNGEAIKTPLPVDQQILNATMTAQAIMDKFKQPTTGSQATNTQSVQVTVQPTAQVSTSTPTIALSPTALPPTPVLTKPATYTVHDGEFAYCLARRFDVNPVDLLSLNGLAESSIFSEGMVISIPTSGSFPAARALMPHPDTWTVSAGESIYDIACAYGDVYPESIIAVNGLTAPYTLSSGQVLQIP